MKAWAQFCDCRRSFSHKSYSTVLVAFVLVTSPVNPDFSEPFWCIGFSVWDPRDWLLYTFSMHHAQLTEVLYLQLCIQNNPEEARQMLLHNPQLAYALLQAQVVMKIVDPVIAQVGCSILSQLITFEYCSKALFSWHFMRCHLSLQPKSSEELFSWKQKI